MGKRHRRSFFTSLAVGFLVLHLAASALAQEAPNAEAYDFGSIISDEDLTDATAMDRTQIQAFLGLKGGTLGSYVDPITRFPVAEVIERASQDFQISPKFLLALIQKEQSLVEDPNPSLSQYDWATGYAVCDGCDVNDPLIQKFKGFYNQVYNAAKRIRNAYLPQLDQNGITDPGFGPGITKLVDGVPVTPTNRATAVLFTYTPHLKGNRLFGLVWERYFQPAYPDGTLLTVAAEPAVWRIELGSRRQFVNRSVFLSYYEGFDRVVSVNRSELAKYPAGQPIRFSNYSFVRVPRGTVYLLVDGTRRGFASREALKKVGVNPGEISQVAADDLGGYAEGQPITSRNIFPLGTLLQDSKSGGVYWVQDGLKHPIFSRELMLTNFGKRKPVRKTSKELEQYPAGSPVLFREGELVRESGATTTYLISNGQRRPFASEATVVELGYSLANVTVTTAAAVGLHPVGAPISVNF